MREHEELFLGSCLLDPSILFKTTLTESHFLRGETRRLFRAMQTCVDRRVAVDYISVTDIDSEMDKLYPSRLVESTPGSSNWQFYETKIIEAWQRQSISMLGKLLAGIESNSNPAEFIERAEKELLQLSTGSGKDSIKSLASIMPDALNRIKERYELHGKLPGISTGILGLDRATGGLLDDRYIIIGARPSQGKSALGLNIACNAAIREGVPVGFISAESSNLEMVMRVFSAESMIDGRSLSLGLLGRQHFDKLLATGERIKNAQLYFYDVPNIRFSELKAIARQMVIMQKVKMIIIDYLQIIKWENQKIPRHEQVGEISLGLKELTRELKIPIVTLAQLRRDADNREPEMADLGDSSQLEKDADVLMFIYHPKQKEGEANPEPSKLIVKKNRDGPLETVPVIFRREFVRFYPYEKDNGNMEFDRE